MGYGVSRSTCSSIHYYFVMYCCNVLFILWVMYYFLKSIFVFFILLLFSIHQMWLTRQAIYSRTVWTQEYTWKKVPNTSMRCFCLQILCLYDNVVYISNDRCWPGLWTEVKRFMFTKKLICVVPTLSQYFSLMSAKYRQ